MPRQAACVWGAGRVTAATYEYANTEGPNPRAGREWRSMSSAMNDSSAIAGSLSVSPTLSTLLFLSHTFPGLHASQMEAVPNPTLKSTWVPNPHCDPYRWGGRSNGWLGGGTVSGEGKSWTSGFMSVLLGSFNPSLENSPEKARAGERSGIEPPETSEVRMATPTAARTARAPSIIMGTRRGMSDALGSQSRNPRSRALGL